MFKWSQSKKSRLDVVSDADFPEWKRERFISERKFYHDAKITTAALIVIALNHLDIPQIYGICLFGTRRAERRAGVFVEAVRLC